MIETRAAGMLCPLLILECGNRTELSEHCLRVLLIRPRWHRLRLRGNVGIMFSVLSICFNNSLKAYRRLLDRDELAVF